MNEPKVLVGCITADAKAYCQDNFLEQLKLLTYKNKTIYIVDNSSTKDNSQIITRAGFNCLWLPRNKKGVRQIMAESHDILRQHVLRNGYDFLFHFETDLFLETPSKKDKLYEYLSEATGIKIFYGNYNIIELLLLHKKQVVSGIYHMGDGTTRQLCVLLIDNYGKHIIPYPLGKLDAIWVDGNLKRVFTAGIGACLIHKSVLEKVKFRIEPNQSSHPDMYFAKDIYDLGIDFYADTSILLYHKNKDWGAYKLDYE
jgi:hypothetical protein